MTLRQFLGQKQLKPLLHLPGGFVGESHRQNLSWIRTVLTDQVSNAVRQGSSLPTASARNHQQRPLMVIHGPALGIVKAGKEAHALMVREFSCIDADETTHGMASKYPVRTCCREVLSSVDSTREDAKIKRAQARPVKQRSGIIDQAHQQPLQRHSQSNHHQQQGHQALVGQRMQKDVVGMGNPLLRPGRNTLAAQ